MTEKVFDPGKYGMAACPVCFGHGYIQDLPRQCCPGCGGFGYIIKNAEKDKTPNSTLLTEHFKLDI